MSKKPIKFSGKKRKLSTVEKQAQAGLSLKYQADTADSNRRATGSSLISPKGVKSKFYKSDGRYGEKGKPPAYGAVEAFKADGYSKKTIKSRLKKKK